MEAEDCQGLVCRVEEEPRLLVCLALMELAGPRERVEEVVMIRHWLQLAAEVSYPELEMLPADCMMKRLEGQTNQF
jgi:hypothetical protein